MIFSVAQILSFQAVSYTHLDVYKRQGLDKLTVEELQQAMNGMKSIKAP